MMCVSKEFSIKSKLAKLTLSFHTQLYDKNNLFIYTVTAFTSISCRIIIFDWVEQPRLVSEAIIEIGTILKKGEK